MQIRTIIIEDEENSFRVLAGLIRQFAPELDICGSASHINEAVDLIVTQKPDLVFMDVRLADGTSFDVLKKLDRKNFVLIIITAYDNYALEAIKFSTIDYLLKPIGIPEFEEAVNRVKKTLLMTIKQNTIDSLLYNLERKNGLDKKINIPTITGYEFVELQQIAWCKADGAYTTFHLANKSKIVSSKHLGFYEELLNTHNFCRIHNTTIINMQFAKSYVKGRSGYVTLIDGTRLEVSQRRKADFLGKLQL